MSRSGFRYQAKKPDDREIQIEVQAITEDWLEEYNAVRPHAALGGLPPYQYTAKLSGFSTSALRE